MIGLKRPIAIAVSCLLLLGTHAVAAEPPKLAHNPFTRPPSERTVPQAAPFDNRDGSLQTLDLRATMVGTHDRLANVGGRILRPGDEIQGYTLLKVYEDRAVFGRQGKREIIYVKPDPMEDHKTEDDE